MRKTSFTGLLFTLITVMASAQSPCCTPGSAAGCEQQGCADAVCAVDPWCCLAQWDQRCAAEAGVLCAACRSDSACIPPSASIQETEPCGTQAGDPCGPTPGTPPTLPWDQLLHGTLWASDLERDVDWYALELDQPTRVQVECWSQGPIGAALVDAACPPTVHADGPDGCPTTIHACLPAGSYRVVVRSLLFEPLACGDARSSYTLRVSRQPCAPNPPDNDRRMQALPVGEGSWNFDSAEASTDPDPLPAWCDEGSGLALSNDLWFLFDPPRSTWWTIGTCGSSPWDTRLALYPPGSDLPMACSDDACAGDAAQVNLALQAGETVLIRLGGWGHGGTGVLKILPQMSDARCPGDLDLDGQVTAADIGSLLVAFGTDMAEADLDESGMVDAGDLGLLLILIGPCPGIL
jgi:hypothetical protein